METYLETQLGKILNTQDVADALGIDVSSVRKYYVELGGVRLGRIYLFPEKEILNALQTRPEMARTSTYKREVKEKNFQNKNSCKTVGGETEKQKTATDKLSGDPHGIFSRMG